VSGPALEIYSAHLTRYSLQDIQTAIGVLSLRIRNEGETAFPDLPTLDQAVKQGIRDRLNAAARQREEAEARDRQERPGEYVSVNELVGDFFKAKGIEVLPPAKPTSAVCQYCHGVQLSALRPQDLRALADVMERGNV
jgi:hypothetical protein